MSACSQRIERELEERETEEMKAMLEARLKAKPGAAGKGLTLKEGEKLDKRTIMQVGTGLGGYGSRFGD